jgi:cytoskeletal protein CcmA (bactofilin family)
MKSWGIGLKVTVMFALLAVAALAQYVGKVYREQGGDKIVVLSGGEIEVRSGATLDIQAGATVEGGIDADGQMEDLVLTDDLTVHGDATLNGNVTTTQTLSAEQLTSTDDATVTDDLRVGGDTQIIRTLTVHGAATLNGDVTSTGTVTGADLAATDDLTVGDDATVTGAATIVETLTVHGAVTLNADLTTTGAMTRTGQKYTYVIGKAGATAGWSVNDAANHFTSKLPASQTASTLVIPITGLKAGSIITGFNLVGQVEGPGTGTFTLDADLRKMTAAAGAVADASVGAITQISLADAALVDTILSASNAGKTALNETVGVNETFYVLVTGTTVADNDVDLQGVVLEVTEK